MSRVRDFGPILNFTYVMPVFLNRGMRMSSRPRSSRPAFPGGCPAAGAPRRRDRAVLLWRPGRTPARSATNPRAKPQKQARTPLSSRRRPFSSAELWAKSDPRPEPDLIVSDHPSLVITPWCRGWLLRVDGVVAVPADHEGLAPFLGHELSPRGLWLPRLREIGECADVVHVHVGPCSHHSHRPARSRWISSLPLRRVVSGAG
jgi:hypothetical protein